MKVLSVAPDNDGYVNITWPLDLPNVTVPAVELRFRGKPGAAEDIRSNPAERLTDGAGCAVAMGAAFDRLIRLINVVQVSRTAPLRNRMPTLFRGLVVVAVLFAAPSAAAQGRSVPADLRYCWALSELYQRYVGNPMTEPRSIRRNDPAAEVALAQCRQGNAALAIPVLERKLLDAGFTLPARQ